MTRHEHWEQAAVLARLRRDGSALARDFGLPLRSIDAERANVKRRYGVCYDDGSIRIRLRHVRTRQLLRYSALVDTLCHELAHLRHFDHGPRFHALYRRILLHARRCGIYQPQPQPRARPRARVAISASYVLLPGAGTPRVASARQSAPVAAARSRPRGTQLDLFT